MSLDTVRRAGEPYHYVDFTTARHCPGCFGQSVGAGWKVRRLGMALPQAAAVRNSLAPAA
jgi:hypothetical protein